MISTHVLDTALGAPAESLEVVLDVRHGTDWATVGRGTTDSHGRITSFSNAVLADGTYRLTFATGAYHRGIGVRPFFPDVTVTFDAQSDGKTVLTMRQLHPTKEQRDAGIGFGAVEFGYQTLGKLARHLGVS